MIAYAYFTSGINSKKKLKVPVGDIKKFDPSNIKPKKLYEVKCGESYERALIIHVAETEELLDALILKKRPHIPPESQLLSPSDGSFDESSQPGKNNVKPRIKMSSSKKKENLQELLDKKLRNLKSSHLNSEGNGDTEEIPANDQSSSHRKNILKEKNVAPSSKESPSKHSAVLETRPLDRPTHSKFKKEIVSNEQQVMAKTPDVFKKPLSIRTVNYELKEKNEAPKRKEVMVDTSHTTEEEIAYAHDVRNKKDCDTKKSKPKILTIAKVHDEVECSQHVKSLVEKDKLLQTKVTNLQEKIKDQKLIIQDLTQLNMELQRCVISHFDELKSTITQMASAEAAQLGNGRNYPAVGYVRKTDRMMHLGRGEWLPKNIYDSDVINAKNSPGVFTRNLCRSVFGEEVLLHSTLTGCGSNRKREGKHQYPKLDENKLLAIHDTFKFWALNDRKPPFSETKALLELSRVNSHISQKISDLKRLVAKSAGQPENRNDEAKKEKNQNKKDKPRQTLNEGQSSASEPKGNPGSGAGDEELPDSDWPRVVEGLRKEEESYPTDRLNNRNNKDKPQQTLNEGQASTSKQKGNPGGGAGECGLVDGDRKLPRVAEDLRKEKKNVELKSKNNMNRKGESEETSNDDRANKSKYQKNEENETGSDIVEDSDGERITGAEELKEKKKIMDHMINQRHQSRKETRVQECGEVSGRVQPELCHSESDAGSTTTDMFEDEISDSEYANILKGTDNTDDDNNNTVDVPQHDIKKKKYRHHTEPTNKRFPVADDDSDDSDNSDSFYTVEVLPKQKSV